MVDPKVLVRSFNCEREFLDCEEWSFPDEGILINKHIYIYNIVSHLDIQLESIGYSGDIHIYIVHAAARVKTGAFGP